LALRILMLIVLLAGILVRAHLAVAVIALLIVRSVLLRLFAAMAVTGNRSREPWLTFCTFMSATEISRPPIRGRWPSFCAATTR
jgi:hypothetical protein